MESEQPLRHESQADPKDRFGSVSSIPRCQRLVRLPLNSCRFGAVRRNDEMCHFRDLGFRSAAWICSPLDCSLLTERGRIVERRLAAIRAADVVGYSRLMSEDEVQIDASEQSAGKCRRKPIGGVT